ncbi:hypothetical protein SynTAK9802_01730 [Synechococcus sp. TAK9802]|nr:hypothetical protein SynTAK9802_01730 [Synechococcus sp. TAK9802]
MFQLCKLRNPDTMRSNRHVFGLIVRRGRKPIRVRDKRLKA